MVNLLHTIWGTKEEIGFVLKNPNILNCHLSKGEPSNLHLKQRLLISLCLYQPLPYGERMSAHHLVRKRGFCVHLLRVQ